MNTFSVNGITLNIEVNDDFFESIMGELKAPSAMLMSNEGDVGLVYIPSCFLELDKETQEILLTHEAGHVALRHIERLTAENVDCSGETVVINAKIEAEADAWASKVVGYEALVNAYRTMTKAVVAAYTGLVADLSAVEEAVEIELTARIALLNEELAV